MASRQHGWEGRSWAGAVVGRLYEWYSLRQVTPSFLICKVGVTVGPTVENQEASYCFVYYYHYYDYQSQWMGGVLLC